MTDAATRAQCGGQHELFRPRLRQQVTCGACGEVRAAEYVLATALDAAEARVAELADVLHDVRDRVPILLGDELDAALRAMREAP